LRTKEATNCTSLPSNWLCAHQKLPLWLLELKLGNQNINPTKSKQPCGRRVIRSAFAQQDKSREQLSLSLSIRKSNGGPKPKRSLLFLPLGVRVLCVDSLHLPLRSPCNKTRARDLKQKTPSEVSRRRIRVNHLAPRQPSHICGALSPPHCRFACVCVCEFCLFCARGVKYRLAGVLRLRLAVKPFVMNHRPCV
jgi:hypothetical protein